MSKTKCMKKEFTKQEIIKILRELNNIPEHAYESINWDYSGCYYESDTPDIESIKFYWSE